MTSLFLDCEWADPGSKQLVSLSLLDETGQHRFYSEVDPLPEQPTNWVRSVKSIFAIIRNKPFVATMPASMPRHCVGPSPRLREEVCERASAELPATPREEPVVPRPSGRY